MSDLKVGRWTVHGGRYTVDGGRWTVHGGWYTVDGGRWTVHGGRFGMPLLFSNGVFLRVGRFGKSVKKKPGPDFSGPGFSPIKHKTSEPIEGKLGAGFGVLLSLNKGLNRVFYTISVCISMRRPSFVKERSGQSKHKKVGVGELCASNGSNIGAAYARRSSNNEVMR